METFKVLSDKEHVLMRSTMYVGSTSITEHKTIVNNDVKILKYSPALLKIINEIVDNSIDEAIRTNFEYANKIDIIVNRIDNEITIIDNGRGLPQHDVDVGNGELLPACVVAWTKTKAGTNFTEDRVTIGANGVGSALTNYLSEYFHGSTCNGEKLYTVNCENGELVDFKSRKFSKKGTTVKFKPNFEHFEDDNLSNDLIEALYERLESISLSFEAIKITYNGKPIINTSKDYKNDKAFVYADHDNYVCAITNSTGEEFISRTYVNGVHTFENGNHVDWLIDELYNELSKGITKKYGVTITKARIKEGLSLLLILKNFKDPKFSTQTKEKLSSTLGEVSNFFNQTLDFRKLANNILKTENIIDPIVHQAVARKDANEKYQLKKAEKNNKKKVVIGHIPATKKPNSMLFIAEGDSALNHFVACRNHVTQGGYALGGKIATTWGMKDIDIIKNEKLNEVMSILNLSLDNVDDISDMAYESIGIFVDADPDGMGSIMPSLISFFSKWENIIKYGKLKIIRSPLYIVKLKDGTDKWFYNKDDYLSAKIPQSKIIDIKYVKGLGQLDIDEYKRVIECNSVYTVTFNDGWKDDFEVIYGENTQLRKDWIQNGK